MTSSQKSLHLKGEVSSHYAAPHPRNSSRHAWLNSRKGSIASLSKISLTSRKVLFGARYVSMMTRTTLSAVSTILGDDRTRILLTNAYRLTRFATSASSCAKASAYNLDA